MKYIAAFMLAKLGKENPTAEDIQKIIESVGIEFDQSKAEEIVNKLEGKNIQEVIDDGKSKLTVKSNTRTIQNEQSPAIEKQEEGNNEEEETLELGGGFNDLFNLK